MNPDVLADIQRRLNALDKTAVRYRAGEITGLAPLAVALGGSTVSYDDVRSVEAGLEVGHQVACLVFSNDLLVLGRLLEGAPEPLQTPTLTNSWVDFDANRPARYYKHDGRVYLSGLIKSGTVTAAAFTLPAGYRPVSVGNHVFVCTSNDAFGIVSVSNAGLVTPATGNNTYFSLDGISFRHA